VRIRVELPEKTVTCCRAVYLCDQTPGKDCDNVLLSYVVKWGYVSKFSKLGFEYAA
jgi:hypothetical protein